MPLPAVVGAVASAAGRTVGSAAVRSAAASFVKGPGRRAVPRPKRGRASAIPLRASAIPVSPAGGAASHEEPRRVKSFAETIMDRAWQASSALDLYERSLEKWTPSFAHMIQVTVAGGPDADIRRLWYLCLAAAFGRYERRARGYQGSQIDCHWDITHKIVSVKIGYMNNGLGNIISLFSETNGLNLIQEGPTQVTIGGYWPDWLRRTAAQGLTGGPIGAIAQTVGAAISGATALGLVSPAAAASANQFVQGLLYPQTLRSPIIAAATGAVAAATGAVAAAFNQGTGPLTADPLRECKNADGYVTMSDGTKVLLNGTPPALPDSGRIITTGEKNDPRVQPPRPHFDANSRNSLVGLVAAWLGDPGVAPKSPPKTLVPLEPTKGVTIPQPNFSLGQSLAPTAGAAGTSALPANTRPDGYRFTAFFKNVPRGFRL